MHSTMIHNSFHLPAHINVTRKVWSLDQTWKNLGGDFVGLRFWGLKNIFFSPNRLRRWSKWENHVFQVCSKSYCVKCGFALAREQFTIHFSVQRITMANEYPWVKPPTKLSFSLYKTSRSILYVKSKYLHTSSSSWLASQRLCFHTAAHASNRLLWIQGLLI